MELRALSQEVSSPYTLEQLATRHQNGDPDASETLYLLIYKFIIKYSQRYQNISDIEELFSIGNIAYLKALNSFREDKGIKFLTYFSRIMGNEFLMLNRKQKKSVPCTSIETVTFNDNKGGESLTLMDALPGDPVDFDESFTNQWQKEALAYALGFLKPKERQAFELYIVQDLTQREAAIIMKVAQSYVARLAQRAITIIREKIVHFENTVPSAPVIPIPKKEVPIMPKSNKVNTSQFMFIMKNYDGFRAADLARFFDISSASMTYYYKKFKKGDFDKVPEDPSVADAFEQHFLQNNRPQPVRVRQLADVLAEQHAFISKQEKESSPLPEEPVEELVAASLEEKPPVKKRSIKPYQTTPIIWDEEPEAAATIEIEEVPVLAEETPAPSPSIQEQNLSFTYSGEAKIIKQLMDQYLEELLAKVDDRANIAVNFTIDVRES